MRKLLEDLTPHRPFGFETSFSVELADHTAMKPEALLEAKASAAVADDAAFIFIDAIDPIGTLNPKVYDRMGRIFDRLMPYYAELGGRRVADVAVYYSLDSKFDFAGNGRPVPGADTTDAHTKSVTSVTRALGSHHIPFGCRHQDDPEPPGRAQGPDPAQRQHDGRRRDRGDPRVGTPAAATAGHRLDVDRRHAAAGSARTSGWATSSGSRLKSPSWTAWPHYVAPHAEGESLFGDFSPAYPAFARTTGQEVSARPGRISACSRRRRVWPANDPTRFASIHSNPPWRPTDRPEVVLNRFGQGRAIYCAARSRRSRAWRIPSSGWCGTWRIASPSRPMRPRLSS